MRPMLLEFPDDPAVAHLDRQYLLGDSLLVAPVFSAEGRVDYYVPAGRWTSLLDGRTLTGPGWVREEHDFSSVPLLVRPDTVLPLGARTDTPEYAWADGVTLALVELAVGDRDVVVPGRQGSPDTVFAVSRREDTLTVRRTAGPTGHGAWRVAVPGAGPGAARSRRWPGRRDLRRPAVCLAGGYGRGRRGHRRDRSRGRGPMTDAQ